MLGRLMQVVAIDAVQPNVARLNESACLNGVKECLSTAPGNQLACAAACRWRRFAPASGLDVINAAVTRAPGASRAVRTHVRACVPLVRFARRTRAGS